MIIELHLIQNFAPSCLNRDDTNMPKDCEFGGYRRARISSQCLKRIIRTNQNMTSLGKTYRTRKLIEEITSRVASEIAEEKEKVLDAISKIFTEGGLSTKKGDPTTDIIVFVGEDALQRLVESIRNNWDILKKGSKEHKDEIVNNLGEILATEIKAPDIALFGRMIAIDPKKPFGKLQLNVDAACQVGHAISTHKVSMEMDFYTAVDDLQPEAETGAGMMGTIEFNSSCFYRYSLIDVEALMKNLDHDKNLAIKTIEAFIRATVSAIPTGKQNSMAAQNPPSMVFAVVRDAGTPWSLANAFEKPVTITDRDNKSLSQKSVEALDEYWGKLAAIYSEKGIKTRPVCLLEGNGLKNLQGQKVENLEALIAKVKEAIQ